MIVRALRSARRLTGTAAMARYFAQETLPGPQVANEDEWLDFLPASRVTAYHLVGTCRMGLAGDRMAVVDPQLRVHGTERLRVVDASAMPLCRCRRPTRSLPH